jgi:formylglycine-generating enzyme required for sulfatase activity
MRKLKRMLLGISALSIVLAASMLLVSCDKGNGEDDGSITVNDVSFDMVKVDGGTFTMGATAEQGEDVNSYEKPTHQVTLSTFSISKTEVTQALWKAVMGGWPDSEYNPDDYEFEGDDGKTYNVGRGNNYPMYFVSWEDIVGTDASAKGYTINGVTYYQNGFCYKLSKLVGGDKKFRLPTEAEWEYAARGGNKAKSQTKYSGSDNIDEVAWYWKDDNNDNENDNGFGNHEVGKKKANALGLYDMSGNVCEWCSDRFGEYSSDAQTNPTGPADGHSIRMFRGGGWNYDARGCRVSYRPDDGAPYRDHYIGFRLAL